MARRARRARRLGPFTGLNNSDEPSAVADDELPEIINFEQEPDGSLVNRPAIVADADFDTPESDATLLGPGFYTDSLGNTFAVFASAGSTFLYNVVTKAWTEIASFEASGWVQYDSKVVLICETQAGGYWDGATFTSTPTMPEGSDIVFFKERFWAFGVRGTAEQTTVWFSNLTAAGPPATSIYTWDTASDFFTVSQGDGEWITGLLAAPSVLYIFRNSSTWRFSYNSTPLLGGILAQVSTTTGADNKWAFCRYENYIIVLNSGTVYEFINEYFYPLNDRKVDFQRAAYVSARTIDTALSLFEDRAIVWYYGAIYCFNMKLRGWAKWSSPTTNAARFLQIPQSSLGLADPAAIGVTGGDVDEQKVVYRIKEGIVSGDGEAMSCMIRTKAYDFGSSALKRMFYYDGEFRTASGVESFLFPVQLSDNAEGTTWNEMSSGNVIWPTDGTPDISGYQEIQTWNAPLSATSLTVFEDDVSYPSLNPLQLLIKFIRGGFARRFYAECYLSCDGTPATSPTRIYYLTMYVEEKAYASAKVS